MEIPDKLYHYTSINSLALILANQTIRFSALNLVNDKMEGQSNDIGDFSMYLFVSCWTDTMEENLAFWNMYTDKMSGVRITLPMPLFNTYDVDGFKNSFFKEDEIFTNSYMIFSTDKINKVIYTNDSSKLFPSIIKTTPEGTFLELTKLGVYKNTIWCLENEWRFIFTVIPKPKTRLPLDSFDSNELTKIIEERKPLGFNYRYLKISEISFRNMEILLGPRIKDGDKEIVKALVEKYNPTATILTSTLSNKIR